MNEITASDVIYNINDYNRKIVFKIETPIGTKPKKVAENWNFAIVNNVEQAKEKLYKGYATDLFYPPIIVKNIEQGMQLLNDVYDMFNTPKRTVTKILEEIDTSKKIFLLVNFQEQYIGI